MPTEVIKECPRCEGVMVDHESSKTELGFVCRNCTKREERLRSPQVSCMKIRRKTASSHAFHGIDSSVSFENYIGRDDVVVLSD